MIKQQQQQQQTHLPSVFFGVTTLKADCDPFSDNKTLVTSVLLQIFELFSDLTLRLKSKGSCGFISVISILHHFILSQINKLKIHKSNFINYKFKIIIHHKHQKNNFFFITYPPTSQ